MPARRERERTTEKMDNFAFEERRPQDFFDFFAGVARSGVLGA